MDQARMVTAYMRRKRWEHHDLAVAIINALGEALGGKPGKGGQKPPARTVPAKDLLARVGVHK